MSGILILTSVAFILGLIIALLNMKMVDNDDLIDEIEKRLPGYNCGGCGYGSCRGMATNILKDPSSYKKCRPLKNREELLKFLDEHKIKYEK